MFDSISLSALHQISVYGYFTFLFSPRPQEDESESEHEIEIEIEHEHGSERLRVTRHGAKSDLQREIAYLNELSRDSVERREIDRATEIAWYEAEVEESMGLSNQIIREIERQRNALALSNPQRYSNIDRR